MDSVRRASSGLRSRSFALTLYVLGAFLLPAASIRAAGFTVSDLLFAAAAVAVLLGRREAPRPSGAFQIAVVFAVLGVAISSVNATDQPEHFAAGLRVIYIFLVWQWATRALITSPGRLRAALYAYLFGATASALVGLLQLGVGLAIGGEVVNGRAPGLQAHPNGQGGVLALAVVIAVGVAINSRFALLGLASLAPLALGLVASGSVTAMLVSITASVVVVIATRPTLPSLVLTTTTAVTAWWLFANWSAIIPGAVSPVDRFLDTTGQGDGESTLGSRLATQDYALGRIVDGQIWGVGLDGVSGATYDGRTLTHNFVLRAAYEGGWLLMAAVLVVVIVAVKMLPRVWRTADFTWARVVLPVGTLAMIAYGLSGPVMQERWFWFPILLSVAASAYRPRGAGTQRPRSAVKLPLSSRAVAN